MANFTTVIKTGTGSTNLGFVVYDYLKAVYDVATSKTMSENEKIGRMVVATTNLATAGLSGLMFDPDIRGIFEYHSNVGSDYTSADYEKVGADTKQQLREEIADTLNGFKENYYGDELGNETERFGDYALEFFKNFGKEIVENRKQEIADQIMDETQDMNGFTADEITAMLDSQGFNGAELWNNFTETLTNIFKAQAEMEMAFETYLPSDLDTTNVYAKGITSQCDPIVLDLNGDGKPQSFAGQMPAPLRKGPRVSGNFYLPSFVKRVACVSKTGVLSVNKCAA